MKLSFSGNLEADGFKLKKDVYGIFFQKVNLCMTAGCTFRAIEFEDSSCSVVPGTCDSADQEMDT